MAIFSSVRSIPANYLTSPGGGLMPPLLGLLPSFTRHPIPRHGNRFNIQVTVKNTTLFPRNHLFSHHAAGGRKFLSFFRAIKIGRNF
jgi:hypothetical protein